MHVLRSDREPLPSHGGRGDQSSRTNNAIRAVAIGLELTGHPGISRNNPLERHYRDVSCSRIHSPQDDTILVASGRAALTLPEGSNVS
jgi:alkylation response protein AidB-like acyl-CoA dehydrogenase